MVLWCLFNTLESRRIEGLTLDEARALVMGIPLAQRVDWLAWQVGWTRWHPLISVPTLLEALERQMLEGQMPPPPGFDSGPPGSHQRGAVEPHLVISESQEEDLSLESSKPEFVERAHERHRRRFTVEILGNQGVFRSYTLNVSEGGLLLADSLPAWVVGYCVVSLRRAGSPDQLMITCAVVENQKPHKRTRLQFLNDKVAIQHQIKRWLSAA